MASIEDLFATFKSFCSFGSSRNLATGSTESLNGPQMDNAKFAKFAKDCHVIDGKHVTLTDVDILFNKAKAKSARKLDWETFQVAFNLLAEKKYPGKKQKEAYLLLLDHIVDKGPVAHATVAQATGIYDKLTNTTLYTGTHKHRFDETGVGKGAAGRDEFSSTDRLDKIVNRSAAAGAGATGGQAKKRGQTHIVTASSEKLDLVAQKPKKADTHASNSSLNGPKTVIVPAKKPAAQSSARPSSARASGITKSVDSLNKKSTVFDRLTDTTSYTGSHKHRFNQDGTGRGLAGRDSPSKGRGVPSYRGGDVKDLSQILRA